MNERASISLGWASAAFGGTAVYLGMEGLYPLSAFFGIAAILYAGAFFIALHAYYQKRSGENDVSL
jgi:hypothetical protein